MTSSRIPIFSGLGASRLKPSGKASLNRPTIRFASNAICSFYGNCGLKADQYNRSAAAVGLPKLLLTLEATGGVPMFNAVAAIQTQLIELATGNLLIGHHSHSHSQLGTENGLMIAELYRYGNGWAFRSLDQGFSGRLAALAAHFGVSMAPKELPLAQAVMDKWPVQSVSGQNQDCACWITLMSKVGMTGCELLASLWSQKTALNPDSLIVKTPEIQHTVQRELLR